MNPLKQLGKALAALNKASNNAEANNPSININRENLRESQIESNLFNGNVNTSKADRDALRSGDLEQENATGRQKYANAAGNVAAGLVASPVVEPIKALGRAGIATTALAGHLLKNAAKATSVLSEKEAGEQERFSEKYETAKDYAKDQYGKAVKSAANTVATPLKAVAGAGAVAATATKESGQAIARGAGRAWEASEGVRSKVAAGAGILAAGTVGVVAVAAGIALSPVAIGAAVAAPVVSTTVEVAGSTAAGVVAGAKRGAEKQGKSVISQALKGAGKGFVKGTQTIGQATDLGLDKSEEANAGKTRGEKAVDFFKNNAKRYANIVTSPKNIGKNYSEIRNKETSQDKLKDRIEQAEIKNDLLTEFVTSGAEVTKGEIDTINKINEGRNKDNAITSIDQVVTARNAAKTLQEGIKNYRTKKNAATVIQKNVRRYQAQNEAETLRNQGQNASVAEEASVAASAAEQSQPASNTEQKRPGLLSRLSQKFKKDSSRRSLSQSSLSSADELSTGEVIENIDTVETATPEKKGLFSRFKRNKTATAAPEVASQASQQAEPESVVAQSEAPKKPSLLKRASARLNIFGKKTKEATQSTQPSTQQDEASQSGNLNIPTDQSVEIVTTAQVAPERKMTIDEEVAQEQQKSRAAGSDSDFDKLAARKSRKSIDSFDAKTANPQITKAEQDNIAFEAFQDDLPIAPDTPLPAPTAVATQRVSSDESQSLFGIEPQGGSFASAETQKRANKTTPDTIAL